MMLRPHVTVFFDEKRATVRVLAPRVIAEVRNYNRCEGNGDPTHRWIDERGRLCKRYFVSHDGKEDAASTTAAELQRFADDLRQYSGLTATFEASASSAGLHVLTVNKVDYFFYADTGGYEGWGRAIAHDPHGGSQ